MERREWTADAAGMRRHYTQYTTDQRTQLIDLVRGGTAVPEAAARLGVQPATAYPWTKATRASTSGRGRERRRPRGVPAAPPGGTLFARLVPAEGRETTIMVRVGGATVEVRPGFDAELLHAVVAALRGGRA